LGAVSNMDQQPLMASTEPPTQPETSEGQLEDVPERRVTQFKSADVEPILDEIYDGVVIAAFGGMQIKVTKDVQVRLHPVWIFMMSLPLFITQVSLLMFLRLDIVEDFANNHVDEKTWDHEKLTKLKIVMMVVVQIILFGEILAALRLLIFSVNPMTWSDVKRVDTSRLPEQQRWFYTPVVLAPLAIAALGLKLSVGYLVAVDSVSIIFSAGSITEVLFNSLAITFIADLDVSFWKCVVTILHIKVDSDFKLVLLPDEDRIRLSQQSWMKLPECLHFLGHGKGGARLEVMLTFGGCFCIYSRQLFIILFALKTKTLPVVRDVCTTWRWRSGKSGRVGWFFEFLAWAWESMFFVRMNDKVDAIVEKMGEENCTVTGIYGRMHASDVGHLLSEHSRTTFLCLGGIAVVLVIPQLLYGMNAWLSLTSNESEEGAEGASQLAGGIRKNHDQIEELRQEVLKLRQEVQAMRDSRDK